MLMLCSHIKRGVKLKIYHIVFLFFKFSVDKFEFVGVLHANTVSRIVEPRRMARLLLLVLCVLMKENYLACGAKAELQRNSEAI